MVRLDQHASSMAQAMMSVQRAWACCTLLRSGNGSPIGGDAQ